ncbi:WYL domain-containing protein [Pseudoalteromonas sp. M8]|uniref:WYL domain-containing protein n=1 Tax=Pseudoalteromonas sp. M8 TaxID=2692624 RepID=UPI001BAE4FBC|nr:WYL domain-containing protein [Pseudoalteromonas sp. M8]QUI71290.1 hypothetical protein GSF13_16715 [Pseudoalteromonas sp. M8]
MDYNYFRNDNGVYTAKRLPSSNKARIKIKDETDLFDLKDELKEEQPKSEQDFKEIYERLFDDEGCYEVEIESFERFICANRDKLLGPDTWIKKYWHDLYVFAGDFDIGELELNVEPQVIEDDFANALIKAGVIEEIKELDYELWSEALSYERLPQIKERCKSVGIKLSKKNKDALIHELITYEEENPNSVKPPRLVKALPILETKITELYKLYAQEIKTVLTEFDYPLAFKHAVWEWAKDEAESKLEHVLQQEQDQLPEIKKPKKIVNDVDATTTIKSKTTQEKYEYEENFKLPKSLEIAFEYADSNGQITFRELRLDAVKMDGNVVYFYGWCRLRNSHRHFRLDRFQDGITLVETGEHFSVSTFHKKYLHKNLAGEIRSQQRQNDRTNNPQQGTGCLVASVMILGGIISVPIGVINLFI